jgi:hypothetical protein
MPLTKAGFNFDAYLFNTIGKTRATNFGYGGTYTRTSGVNPIASNTNSPRFLIYTDSGTSAGGHGKIGYYDPIVTDISSGESSIDFSKKFRFSCLGQIVINSTNSAVRIVFSGTGNTTDAPMANSNGLTANGIGVEFALQSSIVQARLIGFNTSYLTPTSYTTLANGMSDSTTKHTAFVLENVGDGNVNFYAPNSSTVGDLIIPTTPILTLSGCPTTKTGNRFFEFQSVNNSTVAPTSTGVNNTVARMQLHNAMLSVG